nr:cytosolic phospholipase A2 gamma isoform X1 [Nothobranchius furzeri]
MKKQTGNTGFTTALVWTGLLIFTVRGQEMNNMEGNATSSEKPIRQSRSLCSGEQEFINKRKQVVLQALINVGVSCSMDSVPHVALLASGGGQRAAVGLVGTLHQMKEDHLLDTLLYIGGVSGSTWSMASLYSDPQWSSKMDEAVSRLLGPEVGLDHALQWLGERAQEENFSLTDVWGVLTSAGLMKQLDLRNLSHDAVGEATNPYPIYCAVEKRCFSHGPLEGKWFELTPHEAGFTELGLFVHTSLLDSKFQRGDLLEKKPAMDMVRLQGVLGCALAHEDIIKGFIPPWLNVPGLIDGAAETYLHVYNALSNLIFLIRGIVKDPAALTDLDQLQQDLEAKVSCDQSELLNSKSQEERRSLFQQWNLELLEVAQNWSQNLENTTFKSHASFLTQQILPLVMKWEWGTTSNFLYQYQDSSVPACLHSAEIFHLIDAGMLINVAYPSFLGDKRDIDLIIAQEYSAGNMFETLTLARDYADEVMKPFPEIDETILKDRDFPKDFYVFEGKGKEPTIVYMPLFNRRNCKDEEDFKAKREEFSTFQLPFSQDKIQSLLEIAKANIRNNREALLEEMRKAALRRQSKRI